MDSEYIQNLKNAETIVNDYGQLLSKTDPTSYGLPLSLLPHEKDAIKSAIHLLLWELEDADNTIRNSLAQSYIYLAQFIPDDQADVVAQGQSVLRSGKLDEKNISQAERATKIITQIKLEMELLMEDVRAFMF